MDDSFWKDMDSGDIHIRDNWQYELKSKFIPTQPLKENTYTQEFYLFTPNSLQINPLTYSKQQFYQDQTNFIRFKTPEFTIPDLLNPYNSKSPFTHLLNLKESARDQAAHKKVEYELKLLGNIARSSIRNRVFELVVLIDGAADLGNNEQLCFEIHAFCKQIDLLKKRYTEIRTEFLEAWSDSIQEVNFVYVDDFIRDAIHYYLVSLLEAIRKHDTRNLSVIDKEICKHLLEEVKEQQLEEKAITGTEEPDEEESILYRSGLLNKFVVDALLLDSNRFSLEQRYKNVIGAFAAGLAMFIYILLFVWQGEIFVINSIPFILFTVIFYILKDRLKEELKNISYRQAFKWFSDYTTEISSPDGEFTLGKLKEYFSIIKPSDLPKDILEKRSKEFDRILEAFRRPETIIYYKRILTMRHRPKESRRLALNMIFRFNLRYFLSKAGNPYHIYKTLNPKNLKIIYRRLPKVYHIKILMKTTYRLQDETIKSELKKFRLIVDKNGIKRIEQLS